MANYSVMPVPVITVAGVDLTDLVDMDTLDRFLGERGEGRMAFDIPLADLSDVPANGLVRDADAVCTVEGIDRWIGHVAAVRQPSLEGDPVLGIECAGQWDVLHHRQDSCAGFVDASYEWWEDGGEITTWGTGLLAQAQTDLDGHVSITVPKGSELVAGTTIWARYWPLSGLGDYYIRRVTGHVHSTDPGSAWTEWNLRLAADPWTIAGPTAIAAQQDYPISAQDRDFDTGDLGATAFTGLVLAVASGGTGTTSINEVVSVSNLRVYWDRTTAPRVDEAALALYAKATGTTEATTAAVGAALSTLMFPPFATFAEMIQETCARAAVPPVCGVMHDRFYCYPRPAAPPGDLWSVSATTTPGLQWDVSQDEAQLWDYVAVSYGQLIDSPTTRPSGQLAVSWYPAEPPDNTSRCLLIDGGDLYPDEAALIAEQAYAYYARSWRGTVRIPYVAQLNGREVAVDHIEPWQWLVNTGISGESGGPFFISEVSLLRDSVGSVAQISIGTTEGYAFQPFERGARHDTPVTFHFKTLREWLSEHPKLPKKQNWPGGPLMEGKEYIPRPSATVRMPKPRKRRKR